MIALPASPSCWSEAEVAEVWPYLTEAEQAEVERLLAPCIEAPLSFREFVCQVKPSYRWYRHCEQLAAVLQRVADGELKRLMVFMPPRHGKSELVSRLFTAYFLYRHAHRWVAITSYGAELAYTLSRAARDNFREIGGEIRSDAEAVKHWETKQGGGLWAAGVAGPATGKGWHLGVIDDPLKDAEEASSETIREKQKEWFRSVFSTREEPSSEGDPDGALIVVQTRWNVDDLSGWLLACEESEEEDDRERWHIVSLEAIKEEQEQVFPATCTVEPDWRSPGEALCPERRPLEKLRRLARRLGAYFWSALFQQNPIPRTGGFFEVDKLHYIDAHEVPAGLREVRAWDTAATEGDGDYTAGPKLGVSPDGRFFITDLAYGQWGTARRNARIRSTAEADGKAVKIRFAQDPGAAGVDQVEALIRLVAGFRAAYQRCSGDKQTRADPFSAQVNGGNVYVVRAPWNGFLKSCMESFPRGIDDPIDGLSDAFDELVSRRSSVPAMGTLKRGS